MPASGIIHASRSRYEAFNECMRKGFIEYHWEGKGVVRKGKNIYLSTGIWTHKGLELIGRWLMANKTDILPPEMLDHFVTLCRDGYFEYVFPEAERKEGECAGFDLADQGIDDFTGQMVPWSDFEQQRQQQYTFNEQSALVEALIRTFALKVLPRWMSKYRIAMVENDMAFPLVQGEGFEVVQSATIDWVLQDRATKDVFIVSFKTAKMCDERTKKGFSHDTQGLSETWAFEEFLRLRGKERKADGVLLLILLKGNRKEVEKGSGVYIQNSPLIRGYRQLGMDGPEYAHSWWIPKPENKSGWGILGKGWEQFDVFGPDGFELGGVKGWIEMLTNGQTIQPDMDVLAEQIVEPIPFARAARHVDSWLRQVKARELDIGRKLFSLDYYLQHKKGLGAYLDENFPQNNRACHWPTDCAYLGMCWGTEDERWNPREGEYTFRTPHHKAELVQVEGAG